MLFCLSIFVSIFKIYAKQQRISIIKQSLNASAEEIPIKINCLENGLYSYKTAKFSNDEIHALFVNYKNIFIHDATDRFHKHSFENWEDEDKDKFIISEYYEDIKHGFIKEKKWLLIYETYIETNTYEEVIKATDIIIKYNNYIGNQIYIGSNIYIKYKDNIIKPINSSGISEDSIKNNMKRMYNEITSKLGE